MGHYHGYEGFTTFSKMRPVLYQSKLRAVSLFMPPYGNFARRMLNFMVKKNS
jgi:coniferyl-aldehyde dehydrogenase